MGLLHLSDLTLKPLLLWGQFLSFFLKFGHSFGDLGLHLLLSICFAPLQLLAMLLLELLDMCLKLHNLLREMAIIFLLTHLLVCLLYLGDHSCWFFQLLSQLLDQAIFGLDLLHGAGADLIPPDF